MSTYSPSLDQAPLPAAGMHDLSFGTCSRKRSARKQAAYTLRCWSAGKLAADVLRDQRELPCASTYAMGLVRRISVIAACCCSVFATAGEDLTKDIDAPFDMPALRRPVFPDREVSIVDHGAIGDGKHLNSAAIQRAIDDCSRAGGGRVRVPAGRWLTGPLELKSRVNLHLEAGAVLAFTTDKQHYFGVRSTLAAAEWTQHSMGPAELEKAVMPLPLISAFDCEDIAITGKGTLDGQGGGWWPLHKRWWERFGKDIPNAAAVEAEAWRGLDRTTSPQRPRMFQPIRSRNVLLEGITAIDGPFWMINPVGCENVVMKGLTIRASWPGPDGDTPNTDGINPESCRNVLIEDCTIETGDDSIAIKSGRDELGRQRGMPAENIIIRRVRGKRIAIGSEMSGGARNILIRDCELGGENTIFHVKTRRGRGGVVENVWIENIKAGSFFEAMIKIDMEYWTHVDPAPPEPVSERTPRFRNLFFTNVRSESGTGDAVALRCNGLPEAPLENVVFKDLRIAAPRGIVCNNARGIRFENLSVRVANGPAVSITNSQDVDFQSFALDPAGQTAIELIGRDADNIRFDASSRVSRADLVLKDGARRRAIRLPARRR